MNLIKKALAIIDGRLAKVSETNVMYTLSDGSRINKKELNKRIKVINEFIQYGVDTDEEILALMAAVEKKKALKKVQLTADIAILAKEVAELKDHETPCAPYKPQKEQHEMSSNNTAI